MGLYNAPLYVLVDGPSLLNKDLQKELEQDLGLKLRILVANNYNEFKSFSLETNLLLARTCWLERLSSNKQADPLSKEAWVQSNISPDFLTFEHEQIESVPLLWTFGKFPHAVEDRLKNFKLEESYPIILFGIRQQKKPQHGNHLNDLNRAGGSPGAL